MIKKLLLISLAAVLVSVCSSNSASAHFFVEDEKTGVKALFHSTPDHDPIAGEESVISFDFGEAGLSGAAFSYTMTVKSTKEEEVKLPLEVSENVVLASYVFPAQGFYDIRLAVVNKETGEKSFLHYGQRVSRGIKAEESHTFNSLEILAIVGVVVIAVSAIVISVLGDRNNKRGKRE